jgi:ADP-heptose:LPS heptosyltransferase
LRLLVIRNDKLGDFMLAHPAFALLKRSLPETEVCALVPEYTREMAEACPWIDRVVIDPGGTGWRGVNALTDQLRGETVDAAIALFSSDRVALALRFAGIPYRLAPATKWYQLLYTDRLRQRRSRSLKPEHAYNTDLAAYFLESRGVRPAALPEPPYLHFAEEEVRATREMFLRERGWIEGTRLVFVHAGSGGSSGTLPSGKFAELARRLSEVNGVRIVFSAGPSEAALAQQLASEVKGSTVYESREGLRRFALHLAIADVFISGSTGPLHIAGALDRPTAAFYSRRRSATSLRWQTLNHPERRLAFSPPDDTGEADFSSIDIAHVSETIRAAYLRS